MNKTEQQLKELMPVLRNEIALCNSMMVFLKELNKIVGKINEFSSHNEIVIDVQVVPKSKIE